MRLAGCVLKATLAPVEQVVHSSSMPGEDAVNGGD